ncbi:MAG: cold shock domain-containing protein [Candidatus Acidiferrales bacterium]
MNSMRHRGKVLHYDRFKGIGWIVPDQSNEQDIFFHHSALPAPYKFLAVKDEVSYELAEHRGRVTAVAIQVIASSVNTAARGGKIENRVPVAQTPVAGVSQESAKESYEIFPNTQPMSERIAAVARRRAPISAR